MNDNEKEGKRLRLGYQKRLRAANTSCKNLGKIPRPAMSKDARVYNSPQVVTLKLIQQVEIPLALKNKHLRLSKFISQLGHSVARNTSSFQIAITVKLNEIERTLCLVWRKDGK